MTLYDCSDKNENLKTRKVLKITPTMPREQKHDHGHHRPNNTHDDLRDNQHGDQHGHQPYQDHGYHDNRSYQGRHREPELDYSDDEYDDITMATREHRHDRQQDVGDRARGRGQEYARGQGHRHDRQEHYGSRDVIEGIPAHHDRENRKVVYENDGNRNQSHYQQDQRAQGHGRDIDYENGRNESDHDRSNGRMFERRRDIEDRPYKPHTRDGHTGSTRPEHVEMKEIHMNGKGGGHSNGHGRYIDDIDQQETVMVDIDRLDKRNYHGSKGRYDNPSFEHDSDSEASTATMHSRPSFRRQYSERFQSQRRQDRRSRKSRHIESGPSSKLEITDGMKTLIQRRKSGKRPLSAVDYRLSKKSVNSEFFPSDDLDEYEDEDKLPSNRNAKRTKSLRQRLTVLEESRGVDAHTMATLLRDKILSKEPSKIKGWQLKRYHMQMTFVSFKNWLKSWIYQLELWSGAFKVIEGHFGTSTVSYFRFLRWLMFLNLVLAVFMTSIVLLPFLAILPPSGGPDTFPTSVNRCQSQFHYEAIYFSENYTATVDATVDSEISSQHFLDLLQGTGWLENTVLFYGVYYNKTTSHADGEPLEYNMSLAYLCAVGAGYFISFFLLVKNSAKMMKDSVSAGGSTITLYCDKVFGAWDYCISQEKTANLKHAGVSQDFKNELEYQRLQWKKASRTTREKLKLYTARFLINVVVMAILGGALYLIYFTNEQLINVINNEDLDDTVLLMVQYLPSVTITLLNVIVPAIFNKLVLAEDYMPGFAIRITLIRTVLLRLSSLGVLIISLYTTLSKKKTNKDIDILCDNLRYHSNQSDMATTTTTTMKPLNSTETEGAKDIQCWETYVGQQIYKLIFLNFVVVLAVTFTWEYPRKLLYTRYHEKWKLIDLVGQQTFDITKDVLDLVYLQTLCWLGMFFSPIIPAICLVCCFIFFYVKKGSLMHNCLPMQRYGTSKSNSLFMMVLLLSFFLAAAPIIFMLGSLQPSQGCGPFRVYSSPYYVMFDAISNLVDSWPYEASDVFFFIGTGGFMAIAGIILCMTMYYYWMVGQAHKNLAKTLREQLKIDGKDKQFLVARVNEAYAIQ